MYPQFLSYDEGCNLPAFNITDHLNRRLIIIDGAYQKETQFRQHHILMASFPRLPLLN